MKIFIVICTLFILNSCNIINYKSDSKAVYCYDNRYRKFPDELKKYVGDMVFIPAQTINYNDKKLISLDAFYLSATEVTNAQYRKLYRLAKAGFFRSRRHLKLYLEEHKLVKNVK